MHPAKHPAISLSVPQANVNIVHSFVKRAPEVAPSSILTSGAVHISAITKPSIGFPGLDRDADQTATDADVLATAQSILNACRDALADLSRRAYAANRDSIAVDAVDDAVNALDEIATAVSMAGSAADGRENDALIALEGRS